MRALQFLLLLTLMAPLAVAQVPGSAPTLVAKVTAPSMPIPAHGADVPYEVSMHFEGPGARSVTLTVHVASSTAFRIIAEPSQQSFELSAVPGQSYTMKGVLHVLPDPDAPAFVAESLTLQSEEQGNDVIAPAQTETTFRLAPDWRPGLGVRVPVADVVIFDAGAQVATSAEVTNLGNAPVEVTVAKVSASHGCVAKPSAPRTVPAGARDSFALEVVCQEGWQPGDLSVRFVHKLASDTTREGNPVDPHWFIVKPGNETGIGGVSYGDRPNIHRSPAGGLTGALGALGLVGAMRRRSFK